MGTARNTVSNSTMITNFRALLKTHLHILQWLLYPSFICCCLLFFLCLIPPEGVHAQIEEFNTLYHRDLRQDIFVKDDHHYLNVPRVGTYAVYDTLDCTIECLSNPSCFSLNLAASKGVDEKLWCELLSSEKYSNPGEYKRNQSSHHFSIKTACHSSPCRNGGTCVPNYKYHTFDCACKDGYVGDLCEVFAPKSCKQVYDHYADKSQRSQLVKLFFNSTPTSVLCQIGDFGCGPGGWTPVMKINGRERTFHYDSVLWTNKQSFNIDGGKTGFDAEETKLPSYWNTSFSKICLGINITGNINFAVIDRQAHSLHSLIADGQKRNTSLGRDAWKALIGSRGSLQTYCNVEGFNVEGEFMGKLASLVTILTTALLVIPESGLAQVDVPVTTMFVAMRLTGIGNQTTAAII
ncbi:unnamed protein product [Porites lobata]|uniref:EGF-like domain-containing protein n=1 Tax=Porites lobata TaxID=104759 RepID=A0ABN8NDL3_9CNID|nr:unnamed protein product [Porites lobata]